MFNRFALTEALAELEGNAEQLGAVYVRRHCVVLAGPGSGKTKTLTTAMARTLMDDVIDPRGVACITYSNECVVELEGRLAKFGMQSGERIFIGTVHSFALTQVITPYARCVDPAFSGSFSVATMEQWRSAIEVAHKAVFEEAGDPMERWRFAEEKRRRDVDRTLPAWRGQNPELADFIEAFEAELHSNTLIDFDGMPLLAYRMVKQHRWIRDALRARFPVLFVDEYQDLGHALHELVQLLCFEGGIRLFAVGDADQSIYGFTGANPDLLQSLIERGDVETIRLKFNYRSGAKIISASIGALGEERDYQGIDGADAGTLNFFKVDGNYSRQAEEITGTVLPALFGRGFDSDKIAVLYRAAWLGNYVAEALKNSNIPYVRTDSEALVKRSSRLARFIENCAGWVTGGWKTADPSYEYLLRQALFVVYAGRASDRQKQALSAQLIAFLRRGVDANETTHAWLLRFSAELVAPWRVLASNTQLEWDICATILNATDPTLGKDMPLDVFSGRLAGTGRVTLSSLHSVKGREFDAVIMFGVNATDFPNRRDQQSKPAMREARRLFYVGVTRPRKELCLVYKSREHSPWLAELYERSKHV